MSADDKRIAKFIHDGGKRVVYMIDIPDDQVEDFLARFKKDMGPGFIKPKKK